MTEETRDRSSRATMFGRIVLKNKLVDEAALKKVMAGLPAGSDLGEALVSAGLIFEVRVFRLRSQGRSSIDVNHGAKAGYAREPHSLIKLA